VHADKIISEARAKIMCGESTLSVGNFLIASGFSSAVADSTLAEFRSIKRPLNSGEVDVLRIVEEEYGRQNLDQNLSFTPANEAHLAIESTGGQIITAICLTSFALSVEQGEVDEWELRNDWIRDSRSMLNYHWNSNPSQFRLGVTPDGTFVLVAGKRKIEIWGDQHCSKGAVEYVFYPNTMHKWECPFHVEPITQPLREDLLRIIDKLLEAKVKDEANANNIDLSLKVRVEWD
jgi:hypothetical protein